MHIYKYPTLLSGHIDTLMKLLCDGLFRPADMPFWQTNTCIIIIILYLHPQVSEIKTKARHQKPSATTNLHFYPVARDSLSPLPVVCMQSQRWQVCNFPIPKGKSTFNMRAMYFSRTLVATYQSIVLQLTRQHELSLLQNAQVLTEDVCRTNSSQLSFVKIRT
jgi:hypothetical protein